MKTIGRRSVTLSPEAEASIVQFPGLERFFSGADLAIQRAFEVFSREDLGRMFARGQWDALFERVAFRFRDPGDDGFEIAMQMDLQKFVAKAAERSGSKGLGDADMIAHVVFLFAVAVLQINTGSVWQ